MRGLLLLPWLVVLNTACLGQGAGWVSGPLWINDCDGDEPLGTSFTAPEEFDLRVNFFAGEPIEDSKGSAEQRNNSLTLRLQNEGRNVEVSDGLLIQLTDLDEAARAFAEGRAVPFDSSALCQGGNCPLKQDALRATLYLYNSCPDARQPLVVTSHHLTEDGACVQVAKSTGAACPALSDAQRATLDALCESDFNDRSAAETIASTLGETACMYLCRLGSARRGQPASELSGFRVGYGDRVAGILSMHIVDGRAINLQTCAQAAGNLRGMFDFDVVRGRAVQTFP